MANELYSDFDGDNIAVIRYYHCGTCGSSVELVNPTQFDREHDYKDFWTQHNINH